MSTKSLSKNRQHKKYNHTFQNNSEDWSTKCSKVPNDQTVSLPECDCTFHNGKVYLDQVFEMPFSYLFECLFEFNEFFYEFLKTRKITEFRADEWKMEDDQKTRVTEYLIEISHAIATKYCKNVEKYKIVKFIENEICVIDTEAFSSGVIYSDCFKICHRFCITGTPSNKRCRLKVHSSLVYLSRPNFVIKALIDKNCYASLTDFFKGMQESLQNECHRLKLFHCSIVKTSTEVNLKTPAVDKSSLTSSLCSSKNFSSDDEQSLSDETNNSKKNSKILRNSSSNRAICKTIIPKESEIMLAKRREISRKQSQKDDNSISHGLEFNGKSEIHRKNDSLNLRIDLFIKFFLALLLILFIFNMILYSKLREIEKIAVLIKHQYQLNRN